MAGLLGVTETDGVEQAQLLAGDYNAMKEETLISGGGLFKRGWVLGQITKALGTVAAEGGNTGNGTVTGVTLGKNAQVGVYTLLCIDAVVDGGTFRVETPDGPVLPYAYVGSVYANSQVNFTLNDGSTDFIIGDKFTIDVDAGSLKFQDFDTTAVDGSQDPRAILAEDADSTSADVKAQVLAVGEYRAADIIWPGGITAAEKAAAILALQNLGIIIK